MAAVYWDDVEVGDGLPSVEVPHSKAQVLAFAKAIDMTAARFTDDEGARKEGLPGMITPGNMTMALMQKRITGVTFRGLVLPDQVLRVQANVVGKIHEGDEAVLDLEVWLETADGERAATGTARVLMPRRAG